MKLLVLSIRSNVPYRNHKISELWNLLISTLLLSILCYLSVPSQKNKMVIILYYRRIEDRMNTSGRAAGINCRNQIFSRFRKFAQNCKILIWLFCIYNPTPLPAHISKIHKNRIRFHYSCRNNILNLKASFFPPDHLVVHHAFLEWGLIYLNYVC